MLYELPTTRVFSTPPETASHKNSKDLCPFASLTFTSFISTHHRPIILVYSDILKSECVLKVFPYKKGVITDSYLNESRFIELDHPNLIKYYSKSDEEKFKQGGQMQDASMLLMEYAPYGDFFEIGKLSDEKLIRTYFRQLIEGLEYLHMNGIAHMDLKTENIFLGEDLNLKIADFDGLYVRGDEVLRTKGTAHFRAPELKNLTLVDPLKCDIYSVGIILLAFFTGRLACEEDTEETGLQKLMKEESPEFWEIHEKEAKVIFSEDFKSLFFSMVRREPQKRATLQKIKESRWYNGEIYSEAELQRLFSH